jgi:nicotinamidase-related amidase
MAMLSLKPETTALLVIDMQNDFCPPVSPPPLPLDHPTHILHPSYHSHGPFSPSHLKRSLAKIQTGSLAVPEGRDIVPPINALLRMPFRLKCASRDHHPPDHVSFVTEHPGKQLFETIKTTHPDVPGKEIEQTLWPVIPLSFHVLVIPAVILPRRNGTSALLLLSSFNCPLP